MSVSIRNVAVALLSIFLFTAPGSTVEVQESSSTLTVSGQSYRVHFAKESFDFRLEVRTPDGV